MTIEQAQGRVRRAIKRLENSTGLGPRARRNARAAFATAVRQLRAAVDHTYPPIRLKTERPAPATLGVRRNRLLAAGYVAAAHLQPFIDAGVALRRVADTHYVPAWANEIAHTARELGTAAVARYLRRARKPSERRVVLAEVKLAAMLYVGSGAVLASWPIMPVRERLRRDPVFRDAFLTVASLDDAKKVHAFLTQQFADVLPDAEDAA